MKTNRHTGIGKECYLRCKYAVQSPRGKGELAFSFFHCEDNALLCSARHKLVAEGRGINIFIPIFGLQTAYCNTCVHGKPIVSFRINSLKFNLQNHGLVIVHSYSTYIFSRGVLYSEPEQLQKNLTFFGGKYLFTVKKNQTSIFAPKRYTHTRYVYSH